VHRDRGPARRPQGRGQLCRRGERATHVEHRHGGPGRAVAEMVAGGSSLHELSATDLRDAIARGDCTALEAVESALGCIDECDDDINAFCFVYADQARDRARELDTERRAGAALPPLFGIPYALKDFTPTRGERTTRGSMIFRDWVPAEDAPVAERLR